MRICVSGSSGLVGRALTKALERDSHQVDRLVRGDGEGIRWQPAKGEIDAARLEGCDAVVHLAGDNIAEGRWTKAKMERILDSRREGTTLLSETLAGLQARPSVLVSASAIGIYGDRGDEILDETASPGDGFLSDVCVAWESSTSAAARAGIRVVNLRIGLVLTREGGALAKMLLPFQLGAGGRVGHGRQYWSWIVLDDLVRVIQFALTNDTLQGPVNAVSPNPVTNREFTKVLGGVLARPTLIPVPRIGARVALGKMVDSLLMASARVEPVKLERSGFVFSYAELDAGLRHVLGKE